MSKYLWMIMIAVLAGFCGGMIAYSILMRDNINKNPSPLADSVSVEMPDRSIKKIPIVDGQ